MIQPQTVKTCRKNHILLTSSVTWAKTVIHSVSWNPFFWSKYTVTESESEWKKPQRRQADTVSGSPVALVMKVDSLRGGLCVCVC